MNRFSRLVCLIGALSSSFGGCAVGPDYRAPEIVAPRQFMGQERLERQAAAPIEVEAWWMTFDDPLLNRLVEKALQQNLDLGQSVARVTQARAALRGATLALLPSGSVASDATRSKFSADTPVGEIGGTVPGFDRTGNVFEATAGAGWEIDLFGGHRRGRQSALAQYDAAEIGVDAARLSVAAQTADTYIAIRGLQSRIVIAEGQIEKQRQLVALVRLQLGKGVASPLQLNQAEGSLSQVEATLPALHLSLDAALNSLDVLLGAQPGRYRDELVGAAVIPVPPAIANASGPAELIRRRPDLVVAEKRLVAANAQIGVAMSEYYPKFSLSGLLGTATMSTANAFTPGASEWQGTAGLRWRLFDFARVDAEVSAAKGRYAEELAVYRLSVLRATEDVEDALSTLVNSEAQERTLAQGEDSLTRARDASVAAYQGGAISLIEVIDADTRLLATRDNRARAQVQAAQAAVASFRALGGDWRAPIPALALDSSVKNTFASGHAPRLHN